MSLRVANVRRNAFIRVGLRMMRFFGAKCDSCKLAFCKVCADLTTTEAHAVSLSQRVLLFYCSECKLHIKDVPKLKYLLGKFDKLKGDSMGKDLKIEELESKLPEISNGFRQEIDRLLSDNKAKEDHIKTLSRITRDFEDNVLDAEKYFVKKINDQKQEICNLNKKVMQLLDKNNTLSKQIEEFELKYLKLEKDFNDLSILKQSMLTSIEVLTKENEMYIAELKETKMKTNTVSERKRVPLQEKTNSMDEINAANNEVNSAVVDDRVINVSKNQTANQDQNQLNKVL